MRMTNKALLLPLLISASFLTACGGTAMANKPDSKTPSAANSRADATSLMAMKWQLTSLQNAGQATSKLLKTGDAASRYQATIKANRISITGGCNAMSGLLTVTAPNTFSIGPMMGTKRACIGTLMQSDTEISNYLSRVSRYSLNGQTLTLSTTNGDTLNFKGMATAETKYGGEGVRKFIELKTTGTATEWREAKYDSKWIRIKDNAKWQSDFPGIEGFTSQTGRHYIVRIHEYKAPKTQGVVWVKDMVTMTAIIEQF